MRFNMWTYGHFTSKRKHSIGKSITIFLKNIKVDAKCWRVDVVMYHIANFGGRWVDFSKPFMNSSLGSSEGAGVRTKNSSSRVPHFCARPGEGRGCPGPDGGQRPRHCD